MFFNAAENPIVEVEPIAAPVVKPAVFAAGNDAADGDNDVDMLLVRLEANLQLIDRLQMSKVNLPMSISQTGCITFRYLIQPWCEEYNSDFETDGKL